MTTDDTQQPGPKRSKVLDALARAGARRVHPSRAEIRAGQMKFLLTKAKGSTKALAERLGVSRRTVERYRSGDLTTPQKRLRAALVEETESEWQPQVRAQAREHAATTGGMVVECEAYFRCTANGSSDDGRVRYITTTISPTYAAEILAAQEHGATEEELPPIVAAAVTESYFTEWGTRAEGLRADLTHRQLHRFLILSAPNYRPAINLYASRSPIVATKAGLLSPC